MEKKDKKRVLITKFGIASLLLMLVFLVVYMITVVLGSSEFFRESAEKNALLIFEEDVERAQELAPDDAFVYILRAYSKIARYEYAQAVREIEKARELGYDAAVCDALINDLVKK